MTVMEAGVRLATSDALLAAAVLLVARKYTTTPEPGASSGQASSITLEVDCGAQAGFSAEVTLPVDPAASLRDHAEATACALDRLTAHWPDRSALRFSVAAAGIVVGHTSDGLEARVDGAQNPLDDESLTRHLERVLADLANASDLPVGAVALASPTERALILDTFNDTRRDYPRDATIHQLFAEQVTARPDAVAVMYADGSVSYRELHAWSGRLAEAFRAAGVRRGDRVALLLDKTPAMVAATLAVLRLGAAYVPVDPTLPSGRRDFLLADSEARLVVTDADLALDGFATYRLTDRPGTAADGTSTAHDGTAHDGTAEDVAYVMYTSGTTGRPKGVLVGQRAVVRLVKGTDLVRLAPQTRILQTGATGFDATTFEFWGALLNGGALVLVPKETILRADLLGRAVSEHGITTMWLTSTLFNQLVEQDASIFCGTELVVGGEALSSRHVGLALDASAPVRIVNGYGPTENTTFSTHHLVRREDLGHIPIGRPVPHSTAYVLDPDGLLLPPGVAGELHVGGDGLSAGYLNRPELDAQAFAQARFGTGERLYRTGDLARWTAEGTLEFLGRADTQVKIRGYRVEPAEAERALQQVPGVREAVVLAVDAATGKTLRGYATADPGQTPSAVLTVLAEQLPDYLVPSSLQFLPVLPLNRNGKVDRVALAGIPLEETASDADASGPRTPTESLLADLFARTLGVESVGVDDNFFALGGHSLLATRLWVLIRSATGVEVELQEVLETPTVAGLAARLDELPAATATVSARPRLERRS